MTIQKFKDIANKPVDGFPTWKYWLGHCGIAFGIDFMSTLMILPWLTPIQAYNFGFMMVLIYILWKEISDIIGDGNWRDSLTDFNQTMIVLPPTLYANGYWYYAIGCIIVQLAVLYLTAGWTHE